MYERQYKPLKIDPGYELLEVVGYEGPILEYIWVPSR